jgi:hypothetical protein
MAKRNQGQASAAAPNTGGQYDVAFPTKVGTNYLFKSDHRNGGNGKKSQWTITPPEELNCFETAHAAQWLEGSEGWGLHLNGTTPLVIGTAVGGAVLKLAKFVDNAQPQSWHGYPADYRTKAQDRPSTRILLLWVAASHIQKHEAIRIRTQKKCSLSA